MLKTRLLLVVLCVALVACESESRKPKPPAFQDAFSTLPLPPNPELVSQVGGAGALQLTIHTPAQDSQVANYYRNLLSHGKWRLVSDIKGNDGVTALYAEHDGPPLWVRIWRANDRSGTMVQLTGAALEKDSTAGQPRADSAGTKKPRS
ncbi:MAG: hypothetical protein ACJ8CN_18485 [Gemmatimonadales bacterium]